MKLDHESDDSTPPTNTIFKDEANNITPPFTPLIMTSLSDDDSPAAERLINTTELLENVLLHLDNQTLLLSQRVSSYFKATIDGSLKLQRKLFFRLAPQEQGWKYGECGINPLAGEVPNLQFEIETIYRFSIDMSFTFTEDSEPDPSTDVSSWRRMYLRHGPLRDNKSLTIHEQSTSGPPRAPMLVTSTGSALPFPVKDHLLVDNEPQVMATYENEALLWHRRMQEWV